MIFQKCRIVEVCGIGTAACWAEAGLFYVQAVCKNEAVLRNQAAVKGLHACGQSDLHWPQEVKLSDWRGQGSGDRDACITVCLELIWHAGKCTGAHLVILVIRGLTTYRISF